MLVVLYSSLMAVWGWVGVLPRPESIGRDRLNAITFKCWVLVVLYPSVTPVWGRVGDLLRADMTAARMSLRGCRQTSECRFKGHGTRMLSANYCAGATRRPSSPDEGCDVGGKRWLSREGSAADIQQVSVIS